MADDSMLPFNDALRDFQRMRRRADLEELLGRFTGQPAALLSFDTVRQQLRASGSTDRGLRDIPLDSIVGSVGRYDDFTRSFLPRQEVDPTRWARVEMAATSLSGLPAIEVYQIGEAYFVLDGNHRVSVARQLEATHIEAHVIEVHTKVPLSPSDSPDELICKARLAEFLERTNLDHLRPEADLRVTAPGQYRLLEEQIERQQQLLQRKLGREVPLAEAVCAWYDELYRPVVQVIETRGILRDFPERTVTDLYVWASQHRAELVQSLGWDIDPEAAAADLVSRFSPRPQRVMARLGEKIIAAVTPGGLEAGPAAGQWRRDQLADRPPDRVFANILLPINDTALAWQTMELALHIARRESGRLYGLHVVAAPDQKEAEPARRIRAEFERRCAAAGIPGELAVEVGGIARIICERARWTDLVVTGLLHPPANQPVARLSSGFSALVRGCGRPLLAIPPAVTSVGQRALLAYNGSPKANEALFLATYLASHWAMPLVVVTVTESGIIAAERLAQAEKYTAAHGVAAEFVAGQGAPDQVVLATAASHQVDLIIMGGYGRGPMLEVVLGSTVDQVLCARRYPVLICH